MCGFSNETPSPNAGVTAGPIRSTVVIRAAAKRAGLTTNAVLVMAARARLRPRPMQFLKTLFWVVIAVFLAILASRNWHDVTLNLWGDIQVDIKTPVLIGDVPCGVAADLSDLSSEAVAPAPAPRAIERQQAAVRTEPSVEDVPAA